MGRMSLATRSRVISMWKNGYRLSKIQARLLEEGVAVSKKSLCLNIRKLVNVWAGISRRGATKVVFTGTLTATRYVDILEMSLVPFLNKHYTDGHRFQQDNDPKHTSRYAQWWIAENNINWFKTPASSPDLNPIELIWHTLKEYLRTVYKPKNLTDLKTGIKTFCSTVIPEECCKYINHLKKVIPKVIEVQGGPIGY